MIKLQNCQMKLQEDERIKKERKRKELEMYVLFFLSILNLFFVRNFVPNDFFLKYFSKIRDPARKTCEEDTLSDDKKYASTFSKLNFLSTSFFLISYLTNFKCLGGFHNMFLSKKTFSYEILYLTKF